MCLLGKSSRDRMAHDAVRTLKGRGGGLIEGYMHAYIRSFIHSYIHAYIHSVFEGFKAVAPSIPRDLCLVWFGLVWFYLLFSSVFCCDSVRFGSVCLHSLVLIYRLDRGRCPVTYRLCQQPCSFTASVGFLVDTSSR